MSIYRVLLHRGLIDPMERAMPKRVSGYYRRGFTLIELLVVIGIITALIAILIPVLINARRSANEVKCMSNIRQLCAALMNYAAENKGKFPPNIDFLPPPAPYGLDNCWYDVQRIGRYLRSGEVSKGTFEEDDRLIGGVMACPGDEGGSASYAMNYFASSGVKLNGYIGPPTLPKAGQAWSSHSKQSTKLILITEMISAKPDRNGSFMSWGVHPTSLRQLGPTNLQDVRFYPGPEFVGYGKFHEYGSSSWRYRMIQTELDWARHRRKRDEAGAYLEARGRANFGFADGHVESFTPDELANRASRRSNLVALWSPLDPIVNRFPIPNW